MENNKTKTKENDNELDEKYILTLFNEWDLQQEGSIKVAIKEKAPIIVSNSLIYDYIKNNIDRVEGQYKNEYQVFRHFIYTLVEEQKTLSIE